MQIQIIQVPYDSGKKNVRTGMGPGHFIHNSFDHILEAQGHSVGISTVQPSISFPTEIGTMFRVNCELAGQVRSAVQKDCFPLVLAGNCNSCVGTLAGFDARRLGIIWFDAHGDFNTPDTTLTGFLDGMGLAMATGHCWKALLKGIHGFAPVVEHRIVHVGARDLDPEEQQMLASSAITLINADGLDSHTLTADLEKAVRVLKQDVDGIYLHLDLDVLETAEGRANQLAFPGGLPPQILEKCIHVIRRQLPIMACAMASYDPSLDVNDQVFKAAVKIITAVVKENLNLGLAQK